MYVYSIYSITDYIDRTNHTDHITWLGYYSSSHGSTGSILDRACINQLASSDSSPSIRNIVLKASVTIELYNEEW